MESWAVMIVIGIAAFVCVVVAIKGYNSIVFAYNGAQRGWAGVVNYERQRLKILKELAETAEKYRAYAGNLLENVVRFRSAVESLDSNKIEPGKLNEIDKLSGSIKQGFSALMERYPDVKDIGAIKFQMQSIVKAEENASAARTIFNETVERFNNTIQSFPTSLVNAILGHRRTLNAFADRAAETEYDYHPNF